MISRKEPDRLALALGKVLAHERMRAGLTQEELARKAGLHVTYISQLEGGKKSPTVRVLVDIGEAVGVKAADLLRRADSEMINPTLVTLNTVKPRVRRGGGTGQ